MEMDLQWTGTGNEDSRSSHWLLLFTNRCFHYIPFPGSWHAFYGVSYCFILFYWTLCKGRVPGERRGAILSKPDRQVIDKRTATSAGKASNNTKLLAFTALLLKNAKQYVLTHKKCALYIISSIAFVLRKNYKEVMSNLFIFLSVVLEPLVLFLHVCCSAMLVCCKVLWRHFEMCFSCCLFTWLYKVYCGFWNKIYELQSTR
jgi:hypothetical protein